MSKSDRLVGFLIAAALLAGCGRSALTPAAPTAVPIFTPAPTVTVLATATAISTSTPQPTTTLTPTPPLEPTATATEVLATSVPPTDIPTAGPAPAPFPIDPQIGQHPYSTTLQISNTRSVTQSVQVGFLLYLPRAYGQDPALTWPLILFLHGSGENGTDPELVAANGLPELLIDDADYPFVVVSPQAAPDADWNTQLRPLMALVDYVQSNYAVDVKRTYLTGLSMGGFGAWDLALNYPKRFAAAVPIAGGWIFDSAAIPKRICDLKDMPIWVFHGAQDDIVLPGQSQSLVDALKKCGSDVRFTLYPEADHRDSWKLAYSDPALFEWLLAQQLP